MTVAILLKLTCRIDTNISSSSATMSLTSVLKEITSVRKFFESRSSDADPTSLQHSFADAIVHKIGVMKDFGGCACYAGARIFT